MYDLILYIENVISNLSRNNDITTVKNKYGKDFYKKYIKLLAALVSLLEEDEGDEEDDDDEGEDDVDEIY